MEGNYVALNTDKLKKAKKIIGLKYTRDWSQLDTGERNQSNLTEGNYTGSGESQGFQTKQETLTRVENRKLTGPNIFT